MKKYIFLADILFAIGATFSAGIHAETVVLAVPGPGTLSYLPVYLARAIAADQAEGLELKLRYVAGGPLALRDLREKNCDFAAVGLPAIADARAAGMPVIAIGQLSQSAMYVFLLRSDLKNQIRSIAQLKGRRIGTTSSTSSSRSMGYMMTYYLIQKAGLKRSDVQFVSVGQSRDTQRAALTSGELDAIMGDEPFASELIDQGVAVRLADLYLPRNSSELLGGPIVHAALASREDVLSQHPDTVKKLLRMYDRTLQWMAQHTAQEIIEKLADQPGFIPERSKVLVAILQRNQGMYANSTKWDSKAVAVTEKFFHDTASGPQEQNLSFADFVYSPASTGAR
jgi:NitT/TauT family transport system substrate-binding protein